MEKGIVSPFNNFFINIYPKLADDIPTAVKSLESYFQKTNEKRKDKPTIKELKDCFPLSKQIKVLNHQCPKNCFGNVCDPLKYIFNWSFKKYTFLDFIKIAKVSPVFKGVAMQILVKLANICTLPIPVFLKFLND